MPVVRSLTRKLEDTNGGSNFSRSAQYQMSAERQGRGAAHVGTAQNIVMLSIISLAGHMDGPICPE